MSKDGQRFIETPRIVVAGIGAGAGTSTLCLGLLVALKRAGISVALGKAGPSLVDATIHRRIAGRLSHILDPWLLTRQQRRDSLARLSTGADLVLIEGDRGLYDHFSASQQAHSLADLAREFQAPILLVVDAKGLREGIAAIVGGICSYADVPIAGVIANRVIDEAHNRCLRKAVEGLQGPKYITGVSGGDERLLAGGNISQAQGNPSLLTRNRVLEIGTLVAERLRPEDVQEIAERAGPVPVPSDVFETEGRQCRIAVADDAAFHLTVQDNLDLLRRAGAEIVAFSPLADIKLPPKTAGIYFPGGYPHLYARDLSANETMLGLIRSFAQQGGAVYAEGGSVAYLSREIVAYSGDTFPMVGILPASATARFEETLFREPVYCDVHSSQPTIVTRGGDTVRGLRETRWLLRYDEKVLNCFTVNDLETGEGERESLRAQAEGFSPLPHVLFSFAHLHWASCPRIARSFVESALASFETLQSHTE